MAPTHALKVLWTSGATFLVVLLLQTQAVASTLYVCDSGVTCGSGWATGSDSNACSSKAAPCKTIKGGIGKMASRDTLIIGDGTYRGASNLISTGGDVWSLAAKSGAAGSYTVIRAENDFGVTIDAQGAGAPIWVSLNYGIIRGINATNSSYYGIRLHGSTHSKIIRCSTYENVSFGIVLSASSNCLVEQCFAYGCGTYFMSDNNYWGTNDRNIWRSNVVRKDAHYQAADGNHYACFNTYFAAANAVYFQDNICIDGELHRCGGAANPYTNASLYTANGGRGVTVDGLLSINSTGLAALLESSTSASIYNAAFFMRDGAGIFSYAGNTYDNNIIHGTTGDPALWQVAGSIASAKNNIIYGNATGLNSVSNHSYNNLYGNSTNYAATSAGAGEVTYNPLVNGLRYPTRVEAGSALSTAGSGGGRIGPDVVYRLGRTGTDAECGGATDGLSCQVYGDTGWDELQNGLSGKATVKLWPWPNQDTIKARMGTYALHGAVGARGFAAGGTGLYGGPITLTSYVWEHLGNPCPPEICGPTIPDTAPPSVPMNPAAEAVSSSKINVSWTASTDNVGVSGYRVYRGGQLVGSPGGPAFQDSGLAASTLYQYSVSAVDAAQNISPPSTVATATTLVTDVLPPTAPGGVAASPQSASSILVSWTASTDNVGVAGYQVFRGGQPSGTVTGLSFTDTGLTPDTSYAYYVTASDASGNTSAASATASARTPAMSRVGLVAAYGFNEGSGTIAADASGNNNPGTIAGATWSTQGKFGNALSFNGSSSMVTVADAALLRLTTGMTLEAWVKPSTLSSWRTVLIKEQTNQLVYALYANSDADHPTGHVFVGSDMELGGTSKLPVNAWSHLAATYDGTTLRLYVNGTEAATRAVSGSLPAATNPLRIGGNAVWGEFFSGSIDEVRVYSRALSAGEIAIDMNTPVGTGDTTPPLNPQGLRKIP